MHFLSLLVPAFLAAAVSATCTSELGCGQNHHDGRELTAPAAQPAARAESNAERLARGLGPNPPKKRLHSVRSALGRRQVPSPLPMVTTRGMIQVSDATANTLIGFVSATTISGLGIYQVDANMANALLVDVQLPVGATSGTMVDLSTVNSDVTGFPYLGLVQGRDDPDSDLSATTFNYLYIGSTNQTPASSIPETVGNSYSTDTGLSRTSESAVWTVNTVTGAMSGQWVNTDMTLPATVFFTQGNAIYASGDQAAFQAMYPAPTTTIALTFIPIP